MSSNNVTIDTISLNVIHNFLCLAAQEYKKFKPIPIINKSSYAEYNSMLFRAHLECRDYKEAEKMLDIMRQNDDEDILYNLCRIEYGIVKQDFDLSLQLIQELRDKFEDSAKLLN